MAHPDVLGVVGSPRAGGNTELMVATVLGEAEAAGARTELVRLRDYAIEPCNGCERCREDKICTRFYDGMQLLYPKIIAARGLVLGSPAYNYNVTPWMKAFIDRLYCFYDFTDDRPRRWSSRLSGQGRLAVLCAVGEQPGEEDMGFTLEAMRLPLEALGYRIMAEIPAFGLFDKGIVRREERIMDSLRAAGRSMAQEILRK